MVKYSPAGEILNVTLSVVVGFLRESELPLQQHFQMVFAQVRTNSRVDMFIQIHKSFF